MLLFYYYLYLYIIYIQLMKFKFVYLNFPYIIIFNNITFISLSLDSGQHSTHIPKR